MSEADIPTKWIVLTVNQVQTVAFGFLAKEGMIHFPLLRSHLQWLSCVVFGVFLGVCFVDLLSEAILECNNFGPGECSDNRRFMSTWPFFMIGFFVLRIIEYLLRKIFISELCYRHHDTRETMENRENRARKYAATITLVFSLMLYSAVEGIRLFVQSLYSNFASTAFGRVIPYSIVAVSIALKLSEASLTVCLVALALIFSSGFLGGVIGYAIQNHDDYYVGPSFYHYETLPTCNEYISSVIMTRKILAQTLLGAMTFFTFFMVKPECSKELTKPHYWAASAIGFALYGGLTYVKLYCTWC
ncbi:unnamed protein product [Cylicocyclus nassatus]|uniref:Uncharacterized protein n=1 Tax=Cylicocyclus nassatus TaxID=53992 RepID=A0AA36GVB6_CYLNA|nr:unnamed protein product [Cylicocyclus nassatus]